MAKKDTRTYWYDYVDIDHLLKMKLNNTDYHVEDTASQNSEQALQRVNAVFNILEASAGNKVAVIPINLGEVVEGIYKGFHWVGLAISRNSETNEFKAYYTDSLGVSLDESLPNLRQMLINHGVQEENITDYRIKQQHNGYDCGAWVVLNLDSIARTGDLSQATEKEIIAQRSEFFGYLPDALQVPVSTNTSNTLGVVQEIKKSSEQHEDKNAVTIEYSKSIRLDRLSIKPSAKFVISTIMYAEGEESEDSSDEEYNESDKAQFNFDLKDKRTFPYSTTKITCDKKGNEKIQQTNGFVSRKRKFEEFEKSEYEGKESKIVEPFLKKIKKTGLESKSSEQIEEVVSASICLNRPLSLSSRKNNLLKKELNSDIDAAGIKYYKVGIFWEFKWYNKDGKEVKYGEVQQFYKKLKKYDLTKAEEFRKQTEKLINVPYQELREVAKNHDNTKELVRYFRQESPDADIYLSFVDGDTISFNGIYSAYIRIHSQAYKIPTVMSTGYQFSEEQEGDYPFVIGCELDRKIRIATAKHFPEGTYYPEPNFCIKLLDGKEIIEESFVDKKRGNGVSLESPVILTNLLQARGQTSWVFKDDNPLITAIPERVRKTKNKKSSIKFSAEFQFDKGQPTEKDIKQFDQMSQSKTDPREFAAALNYNQGFKLKGNNKVFGGKVKELLECEVSEENANFAILREHVSNDNDLKKIKAAILEVKQVKQSYGQQNTRTADMQEVYSYISSINKDIQNYNPRFLNIIASADIVNYFEEGKLDINKLAKASLSLLREILYDDEVLDKLLNKTLDLEDLQELYNADLLELASSIDNSRVVPAIIRVANAGADIWDIRDKTEEEILDLSELIEMGADYDQIKEAMFNDYDLSDILWRYQQDPMHLMFMSEDPNDVVLENSHDSAIVKFGIDNYDIDVEWIRSELVGDPESPRAALMDFDNFSGRNAWDCDMDYSGGYSDEEWD